MKLFQQRATLFYWLLLVVGLGAAAAADIPSPGSPNMASKKPKSTGTKAISSGPVVLTSRNFAAQTGDGNRWLVELYAPWCGHCQTIKPIYDQVAHHFHESREHRVKVGKIDGDSEKALMSRFGAKGYPSFYLLDGYTVHEYQGDRSFEAMVAFTESDYVKQSPVAFYKSPMGPVGLMQGFFLVGIYGAFDIFAWLQGALGLSPMFAAMVIFGSLFFGCFVSIVVVAIALTPREKQD